MAKEAAQAPGPRQVSVVRHEDSSGNFYSGIWLRVARAVEGPRRVGFVPLLGLHDAGGAQEFLGLKPFDHE